MYNKLEILSLKSKVCGYEHVSRKLRKRIVKLKGDERHLMRLKKLNLGSHAREHLIAYGLMRGLPYASIEAKCREGNEPNAERITQIIHCHCWKYDRERSWSLAIVKDLLKR